MKIKPVAARILLFVFGIFAIWSGISRFHEIRAPYNRPDTEIVARKCYEIVDAAQIWFFRPLKYGGGNHSFNDLDFHRLGFTEEVNALSITEGPATYTLRNIGSLSFDLEIQYRDAKTVTIRDISFNTRVELDTFSLDQPGLSGERKSPPLVGDGDLQK